jgi:hypothetical protein
MGAKANPEMHNIGAFLRHCPRNGGTCGGYVLRGWNTDTLATDTLANQTILSKIPIENRKSCQIVVPTSQSNDPLKTVAKREK